VAFWRNPVENLTNPRKTNPEKGCQSVPLWCNTERGVQAFLGIQSCLQLAYPCNQTSYPHQAPSQGTASEAATIPTE